MNRDDLLSDIPLTLARAAHQFTSFDPEKRGAQERDGYANTLSDDYEALAAVADTDAKRATLEAEFARYRDGYRTRYLAHLSAMSRCFSVMITGPANFPVRRHEKANAAEDKRREELIAYRDRALKAIRRTLRPEDAPIMAGDADAVARIEAELAAEERDQARRKDANAAIRRAAKMGNEAQRAALVALGFAPGTARDLLSPDFAGRIGFPDFEIRNAGARIRRLRERLEQLRAAKAAPVAEVAGALARLEDDPPANRVRLYFPGKPSADVRDRLKAAGFRRAPSIGAWQAYRNPSALRAARDFAGVGLAAFPTCPGCHHPMSSHLSEGCQHIIPDTGTDDESDDVCDCSAAVPACGADLDALGRGTDPCVLDDGHEGGHKRATRCACLEGRHCDVSHDPATCGCGQCGGAEVRP